ncbi:hypothetical protein [Shewanella salipaludis]|uniref:hypothetical protein n=1 Tax=Shewanella salipaludis TaxID=2723052 RepID=UPI001B7CFDCC|nr:hypothetical protein [Shewanella salipaludis]
MSEPTQAEAAQDAAFEPITTAIWHETADEQNPFLAQRCLCAGFDVFEDLLGKAGWIEYLFLLFRRRQATPAETRLLNDLAVAIANPGPRDHSIQAAMSAAAGGSTLASCLMAALAVGAGRRNGGREIYDAMLLWQACQKDLSLWKPGLKEKHYLSYQQQHNGHDFDVWPEMEQAPGFAPHAGACAHPVLRTLAHLAKVAASLGMDTHLAWLHGHRETLERAAELPLAMTGVVAAAFSDLGFDPQEAEILYLLLRLPGAAAHSIEQHRLGWRDYPFHPHGIKLDMDPQAQSKETES